MRLHQSDKFEIIRLVEQSETSVNKTLAQLGINKSTFYGWYNAYLKYGYDGLADKTVVKKQFWNEIPLKKNSLLLKQHWTTLSVHHVK